MPRLIDADAMRKEWLENGENEFVYDTNAVLESIDEQPTVDAVPVVRCKNCEHSDAECHKDNFRYCMRGIKGDDYNETGYIYPLEVIVRDDDFCSYGKRRKENDNHG